MYQQPPPYGWQPPVQSGPAPGVSYGSRLGRLIAYWIDSFIMGVVIGVPYTLIGGVILNNASSDMASVLSLALIVGIVLVGVLWKPWFWSHGGQTPAYKMLGLRMVRSADGGPVSMGQGIGRLLGYIISGVVLYLGFLWILFDGKHQGWHDKLAGTVVISA